MKITFLGTGTSHGVPAIDCMFTDHANCPQGVCVAALHDPKHVRTRCSILIETQDKNLLIDTSQDFRTQMLTFRVKKIDAVLFTHNHADHIGGLADIRSYCRSGRPLPVYGSRETIETLVQRFSYIFNPPAIKGGGIPELRAHVLEDVLPFTLFNLTITPAKVEHGSAQECFGYRINNIGYVPDLKVMPDKTKEILYGLDVLILNALRRGPEHTTHLTLEKSISLAQELGAKTCYFTHMSHDIHYEKDQRSLPSHMHFAHDGLVLLV